MILIAVAPEHPPAPGRVIQSTVDGRLLTIPPAPIVYGPPARPDGPDSYRARPDPFPWGK